MRIAFVTPEVRPFSKTGGLADVSDALPAALVGLGVDVTVFTPCHRSVIQWAAEQGAGFEEIEAPGDLWIGDQRYPLLYRRFEHAGRRVVFVVNDALFDRPHPYLDEQGRDYPDSVARFSYFCRAVLDYYRFADEAPPLFHVHDWQASLVPVYLKTTYSYSQVAAARSLLTIHNLGYQGLFPAAQIYATGLGWDVFHPEALEFYGQLNLLKGGAVFADALSTVSPTYAREIRTPQYGRGLHGVMQAQGHKLTGILNGIDVQAWDPATDPYLPARFDAEDPSGKGVCKRALQERFGLPARSRAFLVGSISRLDRQKGIPLLIDAWPLLKDLDVQFVLLGSGDRALEEAVRTLARNHPERVAVSVGFDDEIAHLIEAGADAFAMPSEYEPCGLNQMYSQRYGTVPVVRDTGGLADTVANASPARLASGKASGFSFRRSDPAALAQAIRRAARLYFDDPTAWRALSALIMRIDHSWSRSAKAYLRLYEKIVPGP